MFIFLLAPQEAEAKLRTHGNFLDFSGGLAICWFSGDLGWVMVAVAVATMPDD